MTFEDEDEIDFPWPERGDKLFAPAGDWENNACVNYFDSELAYVEGYYLGGDRLVAYVEATKRDQDFLVYPITYLYRHYLELSFKRIRRMGFRLLDWELDAKAEHRLLVLWADCRTAIKEVWPKDADGPDVKAFETCIREFAQMDPNGTAFRYPLAMNGEASLPEDLQHINLRQLRDVMRKLHGMIDGTDTGFHEFLQNKWDSEEEYRSIEAEMRAEMEADYRSEMAAEYAEEMRYNAE